MGVDCKIRLPANVRVADVADVIGILHGLAPEKRYFGNASSGWATHVPGVDVKSASEHMPECCNILIDGALVGGSPERCIFYHFEPGFDGRLLMPRSTALNIAMGRRLVDFFGGSLDYNDCDDIETDYEASAKSRSENSPEDGEEWYDFQNRKLSVSPLTEKEIQDCVPQSSYGH